MNIIRMQNICFNYGKKNIFDNLNMNFQTYNTYSIIGPSGCGKSTLLRIIMNSSFSSGNLYFNNVQIDDTNKKFLSKFISLVPDDNYFYRDNILDELKYNLEKRNETPKNISESINYVIEFFSLTPFLNKHISELNINQKSLIKILSYLVLNPMILLVDDLFKYLSSDNKKLIINYLKIRNIKLINVVSDIEDTLYSEYIFAFMKNGNIAMEGQTISVLKEEKLLRRLGFDLPFMIDLSIQLQCYNLISEVYLDKEKMVDAIWK